MKQIALWLMILVVAMRSQTKIDPQYNYEMFMTQYGRNYTGQQKTQHQGIFNRNYLEMQRRIKEGEDLSVNDFMDWNQDQLKNYLSYKPEKNKLPLSSPPLLSASVLFTCPEQFDWRKLGRVTSIKRQGTCGACWSFSAIAQCESLLAISTNGTKYDLSEQYGIECQTQLSQGCKGGVPISALRLFYQQGIPLQQAYPFKQNSPTFFRDRKIPICTNNAGRVKFNRVAPKIEHYENLTVGKIQEMLVSHGPLTVGVFSKNPSFLYAGKSGLINFCTPGGPDHAVLLVGYNSSHWFIKNSWGTSWGHEGYGYIQKSNDCGLKKYVDVMHFDAESRAKPAVQEKDLINIVVNMFSSNKTGWNGNILGVKQNNTIVAQFGDQFRTGSDLGPILLKLNRKLQAQVVVFQLGRSTESIGFTLSVENKTIYARSAGQKFSSDMVFTVFCPTSACSASQTVDYYLTLMDEWGDKWDGTVLGFRPAGSISNFTLDTNDRIYGPIKVTFQKFTKIVIYVVVMGIWTEEIGFELRTQDGKLVAIRPPGNRFDANTLLGQFCVDCVNTDYSSSSLAATRFQLISDKAKQKKHDAHSKNSDLEASETLVRKLKVVILFLGMTTLVFVVTSGLFLAKLLKPCNRKCQVQATTGKNESTQDGKSSNVEGAILGEKEKGVEDQGASQEQTYQNLSKKPKSAN